MEDYERMAEDTADSSVEDDYDILFAEDFDVSIEDDCDGLKDHVHPIDKQMSISFMDTIENTRRFIFAEDLVSYIALEFHGLVYNTRLSKDSEFFFNPFCETFRNAARIIRNQINNTDPSSFEIIGDITKTHKQCYSIYVDAILSYYSLEGIKSGKFLYFCVYVTELAAKCYRQDFEEVFDLALYAILDAFCMSKGRRYELFHFAKAIADRSGQSFNQENEVAVFGIYLEKLNTIDKSDKRELINNLKLLIFQNLSDNQVKGLDECGVTLEQFNMVDNHEDLSNFEVHINKIGEQLAKSLESNVNDSYLYFCRKSHCITLIEKICGEEQKNAPYTTENKIFENILEEILSVVNVEALLFAEIFVSSTDQLDSEMEDDGHFTNTKDKLESSTCSDFKNTQICDSNSLFKEIAPQDCIEKEVKTLVNASMTPNSLVVELEKGVESANCNDILESADVKTSSGKLKILKLEQNQLIVQSLNAEVENKHADKDDITDYNTTREGKYNFTENESKTLQETTVISNLELKQENKETVKELSDCLKYENLNFQNIEMKDLDSSENNKFENFKQLEFKSSEDLDCLSVSNVDLPANIEDKQIVDFFAIYKSEGEMNEENVKVLKGDTILFAEELLQYIMKEFYGILYSESKFEGIHSLSCNAFSETVKEILRFIHKKSEALNRITFDIIANVKEHDVDCYRKYVATVLNHYAEDGLNSDAFLYFCLHFSELAAKFYTLNHPEILDFAICSILDAFCLLKDDWCEFKVATEKFLDFFKSMVNQSTDCNSRCFVGDFEKECLNAIINTLKTFLHEKEYEVLLNDFMTERNVNLSSKTREKSDNYESFQTL